MIMDLPPYDCHCHILPGLDDGAESMADSVYLAGRLAAYGFRRAVCTSHRTFKYQNTPATVVPACERLQEALERAGVDLQLVPSMEYRLIPEVWPEVLRRDWLLPWEGNHILVERPIHDKSKIGSIDPCAEIRGLVRAGYQPVLAHPERYLWATDDDYKALLDSGDAFQRNLGSVEGFYGMPSALRARHLQAQGYYSYLGTDTHNRHYTDFFDNLRIE